VITDAVLHFFLGLAHTVLGLLPNPSPPSLSGLTGALATIFQYLGWANQFLPIDVALSLVAILLTAWLGMHGFRAVVWLATKAHILGGSSD
jgi:hypothetical protein